MSGVFAGSTLRCAAVALLIAAACGDDDVPGPDGSPGLSSLEVLDPPGESIGLPFHGTTVLRVLYRDAESQPISSAVVAFELVASATEATGGSTVSATEAVTDGAGIAEVELAAGAEQVNFRVQATAALAPPALFYIAVSEGGFTDLTVTPEHLGFRDALELGSVELRLYRESELVCADLDVDAPPESVFPPRALDGFGGSAEYRNLAAGGEYTVIAWAAALEGGVRVAAGCVELDAAQVRPSRPLLLPIPVRDRAPALPAVLELETTFPAAPLGAVADAPPDPWGVLDCPLGRAQLLIDCALDANATDGTLDCVVGGTNAVVADVQAQRGAVDSSGCRPAMVGMNPSVDSLLAQEIGAPWPTGAALTDFLAARRAPLETFSLTSSLETGPTGVSHHRLDSIAVTVGGETYALDLVASDRPVVKQVVSLTLDPATGLLTLAPHSFTVDYDRFARDAFGELGIAPAGLTAQADALGTALYASVDNGSTGCPAFSAVVCAAAGRTSTCLSASCGTAATALDGLLDAWWQALDADGFDFMLAGSAPVRDPDADLDVDTVGTGGAPGLWSAEIGTADESADLTGFWSGVAAVP